MHFDSRSAEVAVITKYSAAIAIRSVRRERENATKKIVSHLFTIRFGADGWGNDLPL